MKNSKMIEYQRHNIIIFKKPWKFIVFFIWMILFEDIKVMNRSDFTFIRFKEEKPQFKRKEFAVAAQ